uniref:Uncharacterized protein MANES_02G145000 n=3 Tax=Rhizophora mucronata TaxID=61149 RepID=A0A2P2M089_RHIMU
MCHPGELAGFKDEDSTKSLRVPCVLHMDSIKGTHTGLKNLVQSYLWEEWKERQKETAEDLSSKFLNLRFVPLELPQQENSYDCGLFLLHYLELFLVESPVNFSPFKINEFSMFLTVDWFPPAEASLKRTLIMRLISELLENNPRGGDFSDEPQSDSPNDGEKETGLEFVSERCSPAVSCHGNASNCEAVQGIEITLLQTSCTRNSECVNDPGLVLREFFEPGVGAQCSSFDQSSSYYRLNCAMPQIEDGLETEEQLLYFPSGETVFQQIGGIMPQTGSVPYTCDPSWNQGLSIHGEDDSSSSEPSICESSDSDIGIIENGQNDEDGVLCGKESIGQQRSLSVENMGCLTETLSFAPGEMLGTPPTEGTEDPGEMHHSNENGNLASCQDTATILFSENPFTEENGAPKVLETTHVNGEDLQAIDNDVMTESDEMQATKRRRLTLSLEGEGHTGSLLKDLHL